MFKGKLIGVKRRLESVVTVAGEKINDSAVWWDEYRTKNPTTDKAVLKIGETLEDIQQRLGVIGDNVSGAKALEQASALIDQQKKIQQRTRYTPC
jgi:phosphomevalonate kinase